MLIRIHEATDDGHPVECTGDFFQGQTALDVVEGMKLNPFTASLSPLEFMRQVLDFYGQSDFMLPEDEDRAAVMFLQRLAATGWARFELEPDEYDPGNSETNLNLSGKETPYK